MEENASLYQLSAELIEILDQVAQSQGELDEEKEQNLIKIQSLLQSKVDCVVSYRKMLDDKMDIVKKRIDELIDHKNILENKIINFENYVINCLSKMNEKKIYGQICTITLPKPRKVVSIYNEEVIPDCYVKEKITKSIDKKALLDDLKNGKEIFGAELSDSKQSIKFK